MIKLNVFILSLSTALLAQPASAQWSVGGYVGQSNSRSLVDCREEQFPITTVTTRAFDQSGLFGQFITADPSNFEEQDLFLSDFIVAQPDNSLGDFLSFDSGLAFDLITPSLIDPSSIALEETSFFGSAEDVFGPSSILETSTVDGVDVLVRTDLPNTTPPQFEPVDFGDIFSGLDSVDFGTGDLGDFLPAISGPIGAISGQLNVVGTITESFGAFECQSDSTDVGYGLNVAYNFNDTWGVELGYVDLGEFTRDVSTPGVDFGPFPIDSTVDASAFYLAATGSYYYNKKWSVTGRVGIYRLELDLSSEFVASQATLNIGDGSTISFIQESGVSSASASDEDFYYGISWNYDFSAPIQFQLRYDNFDVVDVFSFGVQYRFGK